MLSLQRITICCLVAAGLAAPAQAQEDASVSGPAFKEGDVITFDRMDALKQYLPPEFW